MAGAVSGSVGDVVHVACSRGYTGGGDAQCGPNGTFTTVSCAPVDCGPPNASSHLMIADPNCSDTTFAGTCAPTCVRGYAGDPAAVCGADGRWHWGGPCLRECGRPSAPNTDFTDCVVHVAGAVCHPQCVHGAHGAPTAVCKGDGAWEYNGTCEAGETRDVPLDAGLGNVTAVVLSRNASLLARYRAEGPPPRGGGGRDVLERPYTVGGRGYPPTPPTAMTTAPSPGRPTPGVVKQDKSAGGSVDTTKTRSGPQRVRVSSGERPIGAAKGKQSDTQALCQTPPPLPPHLLIHPWGRPVRIPDPPPLLNAYTDRVLTSATQPFREGTGWNTPVDQPEPNADIAT